MSGVGYLNIQYLFLLFYGAITGLQTDPTIAYDEGLAIISDIGIMGMVVSILLLVFLVYIRIRLVQVEHEGFHAREHAEHEQYHAHHEPSAKNPRWEQVLALSSSPNESDWRRAILEADSMLASLLTEQGYVGETLGDQLKSANPLQFTTLNLAWEAHRMRNALAHLGEAFPFTERDLQTTIHQYERVFEEFNYI